MDSNSNIDSIIQIDCSNGFIVENGSVVIDRFDELEKDNEQLKKDTVQLMRENEDLKMKVYELESFVEDLKCLNVFIPYEEGYLRAIGALRQVPLFMALSEQLHKSRE